MNLLQLAQLCSASYIGGDGWTNIKDLCFGVTDLPDQTIITFRGSDNILNWLRDFDIETMDWCGSVAHKGFAGAAEALLPYVLPHIPSGKPVIFNGHSLGGGIAVCMAKKFNAQAVTFGCPRVWSDDNPPPFIAHLRVVCDDDPVPYVPIFGFQHDKTEFIKVLKDPDNAIIEPSDHLISFYIDRLKEEA